MISIMPLIQVLLTPSTVRAGTAFKHPMVPGLGAVRRRTPGQPFRRTSMGLVRIVPPAGQTANDAAKLLIRARVDFDPSPRAHPTLPIGAGRLERSVSRDFS